jgi:hypothetical protein
VVICFLSVPAGLLAASYAPWMDATQIGPVRPGAYAWSLLVIALPNLLLLCAVVFALATALRSAMAGYLGAVALLAAYGLGSGSAGALPPLLEPFGFSAGEAGGLLANRLLWLAVAGAALGLAYARFSFAPPPERRHRDSVEEPAAGRRRWSRASAVPRFDTPTLLAQFWARTSWEMRATFGSAPFRVVAALGALNAGAALWTAAGEGAETAELIARLIESFRLVPMTVAIFYAGELVWAERDARVQPLTASTSAPDAVFLLPKLLALSGVLLALLAASAGGGRGGGRLPGRSGGGRRGLALLVRRAAGFRLAGVRRPRPVPADGVAVEVRGLGMDGPVPDRLAGAGEPRPPRRTLSIRRPPRRAAGGAAGAGRRRRDAATALLGRVRPAADRARARRARARRGGPLD